MNHFFELVAQHSQVEPLLDRCEGLVDKFKAAAKALKKHATSLQQR